VTGQDGTLLAQQLLDDGVEVHGLVQQGTRNDTWAVGARTRVVLHEGDLTDHARIREVITSVAPNEIYNLAGQSSVARSWDDPIGTLESTGVGAGVVFDAAYRLQEDTGTTVRVVQASSAEVFGRADQIPQDERTPVNPASPYGVAKATAHALARVYRDRGLFVATTILFNHESTLRPETFVTRKITMAAARIAREGGLLSLGNLDAQRDWGWAPDYVRAMVLAAHHSVADDFIVATGQTHTVGDFARIALARAGIEDWRSHVVIDPQFVRPADAAVQVGNPAKAQKDLGWAPTVTFDELVARMVDHDLALLGSA